ncbi:hypothetical protein MRX96_004232 [Rhipicephalus microplus]
MSDAGYARASASVSDTRSYEAFRDTCGWRGGGLGLNAAGHYLETEAVVRRQCIGLNTVPEVPGILVLGTTTRLLREEVWEWSTSVKKT